MVLKEYMALFCRKKWLSYRPPAEYHARGAVNFLGEDQYGLVVPGLLRPTRKAEVRPPKLLGDQYLHRTCW
ncbi:MAG: hypothetical protein BMS9Abin36_0442 [Gammaproteobacteria bacterium]|nr:MAG: hypothetical protein BMS9Abin36_0442 [Gammaproteobacteria bacterium]